MKKIFRHLIRNLSWKEVFELMKETFLEFFKEKNFIHCASLSYFTVLSMVPIIYLSIVTFGQIIGQKTMIEIISNFLNKNIGIEDVSGIISFLQEVNFEKGSKFMQFIGIIFLLFSSSAFFNSLKYSINEYFDIEKKFETRKKLVLSTIVTRLVSVSMLAFFGLILVLTYFGQTILISFGHNLFGDLDSFEWILYMIAQHGLAICSNLLLFVLIFKYLHDAVVPWKIAWAGSLFTSVLLYLGQLVIKYYLTTYFFARDGGLIGTILVILVWMYYSSQIIFLGAKFTATYAKKIGKPLQVD